MLRSHVRFMTAVLCATAIFGALASSATAGSDLVIRKHALNVTPPPVEQTVAPKHIPKAKFLELRVEGWIFGPDFALVKLANLGKATTQPSVLRLTVRKINGIQVKLTVHADVPAFVGDYIVAVYAGRILPNGVQLEDTTFRLDADATNTNIEYNETNNTSWHNL